MNETTVLADLTDEISGAVPILDLTAQRVAVALYRQLAKGKPVALGALAGTLDLPEQTVRAILEDRPVFYDDQGSVIGFGGLTIAEMPPHEFTVDGRRLHTWCAWDSLFIPGILGKIAQVRSVCPVTKQRISLVVGPTAVQAGEPKTVVVSFLTPNRRFDTNVIVNFCHFVHFFSSREAGAQWVATQSDTFLLSLQEAFALGQQTNLRNFGDALRMQAGGK